MSAQRTERQRSSNRSLPKEPEQELKLSAKKSSTEGTSSGDESQIVDSSREHHDSSSNASQNSQTPKALSIRKRNKALANKKIGKAPHL